LKRSVAETLRLAEGGWSKQDGGFGRAGRASRAAKVTRHGFPMTLRRVFPPAKTVLRRPPCHGPRYAAAAGSGSAVSPPSAGSGPADSADRLRAPETRFPRGKGPHLRIFWPFSLGAGIPPTRQAKRRGKIHTLLANNLLTKPNPNPMGCGRGAEGPPPVVVSNPSTTGNNFDSTLVDSAQKHPLSPLIFTFSSPTPGYRNNA
jgi:hypothetical protein